MSAAIPKRQSPITKRPPETNEALKAAVTIGGDAVFQVICGNERVSWLGALMRAIQADLKTGSGHNALELAHLGQYIADDHAYASDVAEDLQKKLDQLQLAPQNATSANRGAKVEGGR